MMELAGFDYNVIIVIVIADFLAEQESQRLHISIILKDYFSAIFTVMKEIQVRTKNNK